MLESYMNLWEVLGKVESSRDGDPDATKAKGVKDRLTNNSFWTGQEIGIEADDGWVIKVFSCYDRGDYGRQEIVLRIPKRDRHNTVKPIVLELPEDFLNAGVVIKPLGLDLSVLPPEAFYISVNENDQVIVGNAQGHAQHERFRWHPEETAKGYSGVQATIAELKRKIVGEGHRVYVVDVDCEAPWV